MYVTELMVNRTSSVPKLCSLFVTTVQNTRETGDINRVKNLETGLGDNPNL